MKLTPRQVGFADSALRLLARDGMASVTFRTVAADAGMSLGAVQEALPSKDVMLRAMFADFARPPRARHVTSPVGPPSKVGWSSA